MTDVSIGGQQASLGQTPGGDALSREHRWCNGDQIAVRSVSHSARNTATVAVLGWVAFSAFRGTRDGDPAIAHPDGSRDVVLRLVDSGFRVYPYPLTGVDLVLYGDGTLIYADDANRSRNLTDWRHLKLSEAAVQQLLGRATNDASMLQQPAEHMENACADCGPFEIELAAADRSVTSSAWYVGAGARARAAGLYR